LPLLIGHVLIAAIPAWIYAAAAARRRATNCPAVWKLLILSLLPIGLLLLGFLVEAVVVNTKGGS
jgi:hypothetical protein